MSYARILRQSQSADANCNCQALPNINLCKTSNTKNSSKSRRSNVKTYSMKCAEFKALSDGVHLVESIFAANQGNAWSKHISQRHAGPLCIVFWRIAVWPRNVFLQFVSHWWWFCIFSSCVRSYQCLQEGAIVFFPDHIVFWNPSTKIYFAIEFFKKCNGFTWLVWMRTAKICFAVYFF